MTKQLRYLLTFLFLTIIGIGVVNASETTVTFTPGKDTGESSVTKGNVTATMTTMNNASYYQIYADHSGTFSCTTGKITKIEFVCTASGTAKYGPGNSSANVGTYTYSGNTGTWTGEAASVTISSTQQVRMSSLSITYTVSDGPINPNVSFEKETIEFILGKSTTITNTISKPNDLPVTYVSSKTDVATVDASTGAVTGVAVGDATITASWDAISGKYNNGYAQYAVNVREATAQELALLYESWSKSTATSDGTSELGVNSNNLDYENWDQFSKVYQGGGNCGKLGTGSAVGSMKTKEIALNGNGILTFKIKKYSSDTGKLKVTVTGATINGENQFSPASSESWTDCTVNISGGNGSVVITLATTDKRMYIDDIMLEEAPATTLETSNLALIDAPVALSFNLFDNSASQTINYITSSTGAITVSESEYVTTTVDANNKRITVTPIKKTPNEQTITITITQAADETYDAGSVSFTVTIDDSTPYVQPTTIEITPNYTFWGKTAQFSGSDNNELSGSLDNVSLAWSRGGGSTYANQNAMRFYKDNTLTFTAPEGYEIKSIKLEASGTYNDLSFSPTGYNNETTTWTGASQTVTMSRPSNASSYATISKFTITIGLPPAVATPTFSIPDGTYLQGQPFTVTCATEDATLVYTGNGTDPTPTNGGVITNGITLSANVSGTIKVIAYKDEDVSEIASLTTTIIPTEGRGAEANPYTVADILKGFDGNASFPTQVYVKGIISEIKSIDVNKYERAQYYISDDGTTNNQFYVYNGYYLNGENFTENNQIQVGDVVVVYGYLTTYGTTNEFAQDNKLVSLKRAPAAPTFSVADGTTVEAGTMVTITAEEGAEIKYALNGGEKQTYSQPLTINETTKITAVAVKDGLESDEVSATYTVLQEATITIHRYDGNVISPQWSLGSGGNMTFYIMTNSSGNISLQDVPDGIMVSLMEMEGDNPNNYNKKLFVNAKKDNQNYSNPGNYPFTIVVEGTESHNPASVVFNLTVIKYQTSFTSISGFEAEKDLANGTDGGQLTYVLKHNTNNWGDASYVTWTSSNPEVATIDNEGNITLVGTGEVQFTVSYRGNDYHAACQKTTDVMTVIDSTPVVVPAKPIVFHDGGTYEGSVTVSMAAPEGTDIYYTLSSNRNTEGTKYTAPIAISETSTLTAWTVQGDVESEKVIREYTIVEKTPSAVVEDGYYTIKNNGNNKYVNVAGRKTVTFVDETATAAGTVIKVKADADGVKVLRSQGVDVPGYADKAMRYVPEIVKLVVDKLNNLGEGQLMGEAGLEALMNKFNEAFDEHLYLETVGENSYRIYGRTPSMQHVVDFYAENKQYIDPKLPMLEGLVNKAIDKVLEKTGGSGASILEHFSLNTVWQNMGGTLTEPIDEASTMKFYEEVLASETNVWNFAYETAMIYWTKLKDHPKFKDNLDKLGDYAKYIDKVENIRPNFKYYIVQKDNKLDIISEGNGELNADFTAWTLTPRTEFSVAFNEENVLNDKYYTTLYTDFAYTLPEGVKAYKVTGVSEAGVAVKVEMEGNIPAQTPVLLESESKENQTLTLSTEDGTAPTDNVLAGADKLINDYQIKTAQVESLFEMAKEILGESTYNSYVAEYEHLMLKNAGTVNNKYFFGLDQTDMKNVENVRMLNLNDAGENLGFYSNWVNLEANRAFIVDSNDPVKLTLKGDVDRDGDVDKDDLSALIKIILGTDTEEDNYDYDAANVNEDENENPDIADVTALVNILKPQSQD